MSMAPPPRHCPLAATPRPSRGIEMKSDLTLILLLLLPAIAAAEQPRADAHETVIAGDYFGAGANVSPASTVDGDAFVAGGRVDLNQTVTGDALLAGGGVSISERIGGDLYATGGSVS